MLVDGFADDAPDRPRLQALDEGAEPDAVAEVRLKEEDVVKATDETDQPTCRSSMERFFGLSCSVHQLVKVLSWICTQRSSMPRMGWAAWPSGERTRDP